MKKVLLVLMMLVTSLTFAQETTKRVTKSLEETIQPYVEKLLNGLEQGVAWTSEQIPEVIQQYLLFKAVTSWLLMLFAIVLTVVSTRLGKKCMDEDWIGDGEFISIWIFLIPNITALVLFFTNIGTAIKATFFPKLYLVEKFIQLI